MLNRVESSAAEPLHIHLLGGFRVMVGRRTIPAGAWRRRKAGHLVKLLALAPEHRLHREQVMEWLWPDLRRTAAGNNLHKVLHIARQILEPNRPGATRETFLRLESEHVALADSAPVWVDVTAFEVAAATAGRTHALGAYEAALELYAGDLLPEDRYQEWAADRREVLRHTYLRLLLDLAQLHEARGEATAAIEVLARVVTSDPMDEAARVGLMRLHALAGDRHQALRHYHELRDALRREFDAEPELGAKRLYQEILLGRFPATAGIEPVQLEPHVGRRGTTNLPHQLTSFIGREQEMADVADLLASSRLITLVGTGGCGKTRLALEVASRSTDNYPDGVVLVDLSAVSDPSVVARVVAAALQVREQPNRSLLPTLSEYLVSRRVLLLLDNCEHLLDACAQLADALLRACPQLHILATSRESLGIAGETIWRVQPLPVPDPAQLPALDRLLACAAVRLFVERVRAVQPRFALSPANAGVVAEVCYRLDGLPLAIELAAARAGGLPVERIAAGLRDRFRLLTGGNRAAPCRHQTLRALIAWSYDLIAEPERILFARLAVFAGAWTVAAAEDVGAGAPLPEGEIVSLLARLADKSLLQTEVGADGMLRYRLLETLRAYAWERLEERGEVDAARRRHAMHYLRVAEAAERAIIGPEQVAWLQRLERQHDNLRAALDWCLHGSPAVEGDPSDPREQVEMALRMCTALWRFWCMRGYLSEGRRWIQTTLAAVKTRGHDSDSPSLTLLVAKALNGAAQLTESQGDHAGAIALHEASLDRYRQVGDRAGIAAALNSLGMIACNRRDYARAVALHEESLALFRALGDKRGIAEALTNLGRVVSDLNDQARAAALHEEALRLHRELGDKQAIAYALIHLAMVVYIQRDWTRVRMLHEEALRLHHELGDKAGMARSLRSLGALARRDGDYVRAEGLYTESLRLFREAEGTWGIALVLRDLGLVAHYQDDRRRAAALYAEAFKLLCSLEDTRGVAEALEALAGVVRANVLDGVPALQGQDPVAAARSSRLLGAAEAIRASIGVPHPDDHPAAYRYNLAPGHAALGEQAFTAAWAAGKALSLEQAIEYALEFVETAPVATPLATTPQPPIFLSPREREVARLVAQGLTNRQIAAKLGIAARTADTHVGHLLHKLGVASRMEVASAIGGQPSDLPATG